MPSGTTNDRWCLVFPTRSLKVRATAPLRSMLRRSLQLGLYDPIQFTSLFVCQAPRSCEELRLRKYRAWIVLTR